MYIVSKSNEIIEFAAVKVEDDKIVQSMNFFLKPQKSISSEITRINGFTNKMVRVSGLDYAKSLLQIRNFLDSKYTFIARSCIDFDFKFINDQFQKYALGIPSNPFYAL